MENAIVILNTADIPGALQVAADLPSYTVYVFDPVLVDTVRASGLRNVEFAPWHNCPPFQQHDPDSRLAAFALEAELDLALRDIVPGISIASWQHLNLFYLFYIMNWYSGLWQQAAPRLKNKKVYLFVCDNPGSYYFNSFIPASLLVAQLQKEQIELAGFTYGAQEDTSDLMPDLRGLNASNGQEQILAHLPTCWYDARYFIQEALAAGKSLIALRAKLFDIPLPVPAQLGLTSASAVLAGGPQEQRELVDAFTGRVAQTLERLLAPHLPLPHYRARQVDQLSSLYRAQLLTYFELDRYFGDIKPSKLLLADHDAGFHGPLVSFAKKHALPVLLLPHAKTVNHLEFTYRNITAFSHPIQAQEVFDAAGRRVLNLKLAYPENHAGSSAIGELKTVSLLLNSLSLGGIYATRYETYMAGIRQIVAWCHANKIELKVRCKPSYTIIDLLARDAGLNPAVLMDSVQESMETFMASCDLCLMYDTPTSGAINFLKNSIPILNPVVDALAPVETAMGNINVVPPESVDITLRRLKGFKSDPSSLLAFRMAQFRNYILLFQDARPLRNYL